MAVQFGTLLMNKVLISWKKSKGSSLEQLMTLNTSLNGKDRKNLDCLAFERGLKYI